MHDIIKRNKELWDLFTIKDEYFQENNWKYINGRDDGKNNLEPKVSKFLIENKFHVEYPDNKKFAVCLTHDVDDIYPTFSHTLLSSLYCLKDLNINELNRQVLWKIRGKEFSPYRNFKEIIRLEEKYNAISSFYFMTADRDVRRFRYNIEDIENDIGFIKDNGWEVGLHGGYYSYHNLNEIKNEKQRLEKVVGKKVIGYRNHYLRFKVPDTWDLLTKAGLKYDTTFGYNKNVGFRNGMCHPFKPFNLNEEKEIDILEIPLIIMDSAIFNLTKSNNEVWKLTKRIIDIIESNNGVLTILWHNNSFDSPLRMNYSKLYDKILKYCYEKNGWITSGENIWKFYNDRI